MSSPRDEQAAIHWSAFRYVSDEMTPDEAASFELQLAEDQAAREAVAQAVALVACVRHAEADVRGAGTSHTAPAELVSPARAVNRHWLQPLAWTSVGAAACLLTMLGGQALLNWRGDSSAVVPARATSDEQLAVAWSDLRQDEPEVVYDSEAEHEIVPVTAEDQAVESDEPEIAPSWLLTAVGGDELAGQPEEE